MKLDDMDDGDFDEIPPGLDAVSLDREPPELEWDESETSLAVEDVIGRSQRYSRGYS
jgi:hypothetical protein